MNILEKYKKLKEEIKEIENNSLNYLIEEIKKNSHKLSWDISFWGNCSGSLTSTPESSKIIDASVHGLTSYNSYKNLYRSVFDRWVISFSGADGLLEVMDEYCIAPESINRNDLQNAIVESSNRIAIVKSLLSPKVDICEI